MLLIAAASCGSKDTTAREPAGQQQDIDEVRSLPPYNITDSLMQGSHKLVYTITGMPDDELPIVVDEDGMKYKDNRYTLVILKDGTPFFERSFTKADFKSQLTPDFVEYGIMDGLHLESSKEGMLRFYLCVTYPESDGMTSPFVLTIAPDGSYRIDADTSFDEDIPAPTWAADAND